MKPRNKKTIIAVGIVLITILSSFLLLLAAIRSTQESKYVPISEILNRAEAQELREANIVGNNVVVVDNEGNTFKSTKEDGAPVGEILRKSGVEVTVAGPQQAGFPTPVIIIGLIGLGAVVWFVIRQGGMNSQVFSFGSSHARAFDANRPTVTFLDVAGVEEAKEELKEVVQFLKYPKRFTALGAKIPKGVLLIGPPGTGKTLIAKAVAGEAGVPFFSISGSEFVEMFVGVGASRVRHLFKQAKKHVSSIVFIDEIDAVGRQRGANANGNNDEREQTLNQLLVEMDGFDSNTNVIVMAATNRPDILDQALLRPGRFDRQVMLDRPDVGGRAAILAVHARNKPLEEAVDFQSIARLTSGFSGADLSNLLNEAAILAARSKKTEIGHTELEEAILRVIAGPERRSRIISEEEKTIVAYHEVGHALVMKSLKHADNVQKVSIISRGQALGITVQIPKEDKLLATRSQLIARMSAAMGGRVAEEIIFGEITTGARQDIEVATDIAKKMVCEFGMSTMGTVAFKRRIGFEGESMSESLESRVDAAILALVDEAYKTARDILVARKDKLIEIAEHLKVVETIDGEELHALLQKKHLAKCRFGFGWEMPSFIRSVFGRRRLA